VLFWFNHQMVQCHCWKEKLIVIAVYFSFLLQLFFCSRKVNTWQLSKLAVHEHSPIKRNTTNSNDFSVVQLQYVPHYRLSTLQILVEIYTFIIYGWICFLLPFFFGNDETTKLHHQAQSKSLKLRRQ
jgi:hypothetical protein